MRQGELIFKAGQRDVGLTVVLSGELEAFEARDGQELILATPGPRDFVGDVAMLTGTAVLANVRGKATESESSIPGGRASPGPGGIAVVGEPIVTRLHHATATLGAGS